MADDMLEKQSKVLIDFAQSDKCRYDDDNVLSAFSYLIGWVLRQEQHEGCDVRSAAPTELSVMRTQVVAPNVSATYAPSARTTSWMDTLLQSGVVAAVAELLRRAPSRTHDRARTVAQRGACGSSPRRSVSLEIRCEALEFCACLVESRCPGGGLAELLDASGLLVALLSRLDDADDGEDDSNWSIDPHPPCAATALTPAAESVTSARQLTESSGRQFRTHLLLLLQDIFHVLPTPALRGRFSYIAPSLLLTPLARLLRVRPPFSRACAMPGQCRTTVEGLKLLQILCAQHPTWLCGGDELVEKCVADAHVCAAGDGAWRDVEAGLLRLLHASVDAAHGAACVHLVPECTEVLLQSLQAIRGMLLLRVQHAPSYAAAAGVSGMGARVGVAERHTPALSNHVDRLSKSPLPLVQSLLGGPWARCDALVRRLATLLRVQPARVHETRVVWAVHVAGLRVMQDLLRWRAHRRPTTEAAVAEITRWLCDTSLLELCVARLSGTTVALHAVLASLQRRPWTTNDAQTRATPDCCCGVTLTTLDDCRQECEVALHVVRVVDLLLAYTGEVCDARVSSSWSVSAATWRALRAVQHVLTRRRLVTVVADLVSTVHHITRAVQLDGGKEGRDVSHAAAGECGADDVTAIVLSEDVLPPMHDAMRLLESLLVWRALCQGASGETDCASRGADGARMDTATGLCDEAMCCVYLLEYVTQCLTCGADVDKAPDAAPPASLGGRLLTCMHVMRRCWACDGAPAAAGYLPVMSRLCERLLSLAGSRACRVGRTPEEQRDLQCAALDLLYTMVTAQARGGTMTALCDAVVMEAVLHWHCVALLPTAELVMVEHMASVWKAREKVVCVDGTTRHVRPHRSTRCTKADVLLSLRVRSDADDVRHEDGCLVRELCACATPFAALQGDGPVACVLVPRSVHATRRARQSPCDAAACETGLLAASACARLLRLLHALLVRPSALGGGSAALRQAQSCWFMRGVGCLLCSLVHHSSAWLTRMECGMADNYAPQRTTRKGSGDFALAVPEARQESGDVVQRLLRLATTQVAQGVSATGDAEEERYSVVWLFAMSVRLLAQFLQPHWCSSEWHRDVLSTDNHRFVQCVTDEVCVAEPPSSGGLQDDSEAVCCMYELTRCWLRNTCWPSLEDSVLIKNCSGRDAATLRRTVDFLRQVVTA